VEFDAPAEQTQSILRNIERLQPLLIVRDYQSSLAQAAADSKGKAARRLATITTSFQLQALIPVSPEEAARQLPQSAAEVRRGQGSGVRGRGKRRTSSKKHKVIFCTTVKLLK